MTLYAVINPVDSGVKEEIMENNLMFRMVWDAACQVIRNTHSPKKYLRSREVVLPLKTLASRYGSNKRTLGRLRTKLTQYPYSCFLYKGKRLIKSRVTDIYEFLDNDCVSLKNLVPPENKFKKVVREGLAPITKFISAPQSHPKENVGLAL